MGVIRRQGSTDSPAVYLYQSHTVGRASSCELVLDRCVISGHHATLRWAEGAWTLRDLGSRNGTFVNGQRLGFGVEGRPTRLDQGDVITFADESEAWELVDASPPRSLLIPLAPEAAVIELDGHDVLAFPSAEQPRVTIYQHEGRWQLERERERAELHDGQELELDARRYRILITEPIEPTLESASSPSVRRVEDLELELRVARDEESAAVVTTIAGERRELPPRTAFYLLVFLARRRVEQAPARGVDAGWIGVDVLCRELGLANASALAVMVFRCRKAMRASEVEDPAAIIDRSRRGQLRIGIAARQLTVTTLD